MAEENKNKVDFPDESTPRGNAEPLLTPIDDDECRMLITPTICANPKSPRYDATPPPPPPVKQFPEGDGRDPYRAQIEPHPKLPPIPPDAWIVKANPKGSRYDNSFYPPRRNWTLISIAVLSALAAFSFFCFYLLR